MDTHKKQHVPVLLEHLVPICVVYINVYGIYKTWCEYEPNQTTDYAVNLGLIMSKIRFNNGCFNILAYTEQQQTTGHVDNDCRQFQ